MRSRLKITKAIFKNFAAISHGTGSKYIEIDLSKAVNKICLLIGPNGCGKTSILSLLHPFSGLGNLDVRNNNTLILKDMNGYKELHIQKDDDVYIIKHFYTAHKDRSHSVKSYIEKNGIELNSNGNVRSFEEMVKIELGIETDFLKLIRLGDNVTSLIDLSETERKTFMGKILEDIGVYLTFYKKLNDDIKQLNQMISHDVDKLNRLGIDDKEVLKSQIKECEKLLDEEQENYGIISGELSVYEHELELIPEKETLRLRLADVSKKHEKMKKVVEKKNDLESTELSFYENKIIEYEKKIIANQAYIQSTKILIQNYLEQLNDLEEQLRLVSVQYKKEEESDIELQKMVDQSLLLRDEVTLENIDFIDPPKVQKSELEEFIAFLKGMNQILERTYSFGKEPMKEVLRLIKDKRNVISYINSHLLDIDDNESDSALFLHAIEKRFHFSSEEPNVTCKDTDCEARKLWVQVYNLMNTYREEKENKKDTEFYQNMESIYTNLQVILPKITQYESVIRLLPDHIKKSFITKNLFKSLGSGASVYSEKDMNDYMSFVTEYDNHLKKIKTLDELDVNIERYRGMSNMKYLKKQITSINEKIDSLRGDIQDKKKSISKMEEDNQELSYSIESCVEIKDALEKYDSITEELDKLSSYYDSFLEYTKKRDAAERRQHQSRMSIDILTDKIQKMKSDLFQYIEIKKELKLYNLVFDEMTLTKKSFSSKEGMPLYHMKDYLETTVDITNELLDIAYNGQKFIDRFQISQTSFTIPFYNKGVLLPDVKYASQGELSFLSIALSFALASQALTGYTIMLFDEIDAALDTTNREKFIKILERQIEIIGSEQNFLITHNNMFSSYPVDIIDLNFENEKDDNNYTLANYIPVIRKAA